MTAARVRLLLLVMHRAIQTALALCAFALGVILVLGTVRTDWPLPPFLLERLSQRLQAEGLSVSWDSAQVDLMGGFRARQVRIEDAALHSPVAHFPAVYLQLDWRHLLADRRSLACTVHVLNGSLWLAPPDRLRGPPGPPALRRIDLTARIQGKRFSIRHFQALVLADFPLSGQLEGKIMPSEQPALRPERRPTWRERWLDASRQAAPLEEWIAQLESPTLRFRGTSSPEQRPTAVLAFSTHSWRNETTRAGWIRASGEVSLLDPSLSQIRVFGQGLAHPSGQASLLTGWVELLPVGSPGPGWVRRAHLGLADASWEGRPLGTLTLRGRPSGAGQWDGVLTLAHEEAFLRAQGKILPAKGEAILRTRAWVQPGVVDAVPPEWIAAIGHPFRMGGPLLLEGEFSWHRGWQLQSGRGSVSTGKVDFAGIPAKGAETTFLLGPEQITIGPAGIESDHLSLVLTYTHHLRTRDFRFLIQGRLRPQDLNPIIEDWWDAIWERVRFASPTAQVDLDYTGRWGDLSRTRVFAGVVGSDFSYLGLPLQSCRLQLSYEPGYLAFPNLEAESAGGPVSGKIQWIYPSRTGTDRSIVLLEADSSLPLEDLRVFAEEAGDLAKRFRFSTAPRIHLRGWSVFTPQEEVARRLWDLRLETPDPVEVAGLPLDRLSLEARVETDRIVVHSASSVLHGGALAVRAEIDGSPEAVIPTQLHLELTRARLDPTWDSLRQMVEPERTPEPSPEAGLAPSPNTAPGTLSIQARLSGPADPAPADMTGTASFQITGGDLGRVNLLGALSRVLSVVGLGFTSLHFSEANGELEIRPDRLVMQQVEVSGPRASITGQGTLSRPEGALEVSAKLFYLHDEGLSLQAVVGQIFRPLGHVFPLRLRGTLDHPQWRLQMDPRNLFRRQDSSLRSPAESQN